MDAWDSCLGNLFFYLDICMSYSIIAIFIKYLLVACWHAGHAGTRYYQEFKLAFLGKRRFAPGNASGVQRRAGRPSQFNSQDDTLAWE